MNLIKTGLAGCPTTPDFEKIELECLETVQGKE
jgi:hypothetical protein